MRICERILRKPLNPPDLCAQAAEISLQGLVAPVDVVHTGKLAASLRSQGSHRQRRSAPEIRGPHLGASLPLTVNYRSQNYRATLTVPEGALQAGNNYTYTVKVRNKNLEVSEATIAKWNDVDGGEVGADL